jgi:hypothetical protein
MAEKYQPISPYVYVANNPLKFIDPNGKHVIVEKSQRDGKTHYKIKSPPFATSLQVINNQRF